MFKSLSKIAVALTASVSLILPLSATAGVYDGGNGSSNYGGGSGGGSIWDLGFGSSATRYATNNKALKSSANWGANPVKGQSVASTTAAKTKKITDYIYSVQPQCRQSTVRAVFGLQYQGPGWKQVAANAGPTADHSYNYSNFRSLYRKYGPATTTTGKKVLSQINSSKRVSKVITCVTVDPTPPPPRTTTTTKPRTTTTPPRTTTTPPRTTTTPPRTTTTPPTVIRNRWIASPVYEPQSNYKVIECVYSRSTAVTRQISGVDPSTGARIDPIGKNNLEDQPANFEKTKFGQLIDDYESRSTPPSADAAETALRQACAEDAASDGPKVDLTNRNKDGLAEGGVLNVTEREVKATYIIGDSVERLVSCREHEESSTNGGAWVRTGAERNCNPMPPATRNATPTTADLVLQTPAVTGFWQMISVHCNSEDFNKLKDATPGIKVIMNSDDSSGKISAFAYSPTYATVPSNLDFGDATNSNVAKALTSSLGFYDKECPFECSANKSGPGASSANGAVNNVNNPNPETNTKYGAVSEDTVNDNSFTFFRDNKPNKLTLDVWYPTNDKGVKYDGKAPITTTITRLESGTPGIEGKSGGKFTMKAKRGSEPAVDVFDPDGSVEKQRNWDPAEGKTPKTFATRKAALLDGLYRDFTVQATWASDKDKPQVLNVKWEYAPNVEMTIPTKGLGFKSNGTQDSGASETVSAPIQGKCYANYGSTTNVDTTDAFHKNTGSGTNNELDGTLLESNGDDNPEFSSIKDHQTNLFIKFVRSTTE